MNALVSLNSGTMPRFSTDPTASSVNRFITRRAALASRPDTGEERCASRASTPFDVLYPSLYAERGTHPTWWLNYLRVAAAVVTLGMFSGR